MSVGFNTSWWSIHSFQLSGTVERQPNQRHRLLASAAIMELVHEAYEFVQGEPLILGLRLHVLQAFGAKALKEVGNWWQRSILILWMTCIPISLLWWFMEPLLLLIGQEASVAHMTTMYLR